MSKPPARIDSPSGYAPFLDQIRKILSEGKERARKAVEMERVRAYWEAGGVVKEYLRGRDSQYGGQIIGKLSVDIDLPAHLVYDMLRFKELFVKFVPGRKLTWTHYRRLMRVVDEETRGRYLSSAVEHGWSVRELEARVKEGSLPPTPLGAGSDAKTQGEPRPVSAGPGEKRLVAKRGELSIYRVIKRRGRKVLDLGFKDHRRLPGEFAFEPGDTVRSIEDDTEPFGHRYQRAEKRKKFYSYRATVVRVIDGDTLWAEVDFGSDHTSDVKLRLRAIDTPELNTEAGKRAKAYLEDLLLPAQSFVITTTKVDLYDRYLTDVFVLPGERDMEKVAREGRFVNRELVEAGLARRWTREKPPEF